MIIVVAVPVSRGTMKKYQTRHIRQVEHAIEQHEVWANKVANKSDRRKWLERQNSTNYRNDYDRVRGEFSHYKTPCGSPARLK